MSNVVSAKRVIAAATTWEAVYSTEKSVPKGTEAILDSIFFKNTDTGTPNLSLAVTDGAAPTAFDVVYNPTAITANGFLVAIGPAATIKTIALKPGQTLWAQTSAAAGEVVAVAFGRVAQEGGL